MGTVCHASENSMRELKTLNITDKIDTQFANGPVRLGARQGVCTNVVWSDVDHEANLQHALIKPLQLESYAYSITYSHADRSFASRLR